MMIHHVKLILVKALGTEVITISARLWITHLIKI